MTLERPAKGERYLHFKGKNYEVLGVGIYTETGEEVVIYSPVDDQGLLDTKQLFVRPLQMFMEEIEVSGEKTPRFKFIPRT